MIGPAARNGRRLRADSLGPVGVAGIVAWAGDRLDRLDAVAEHPPRAGFDLALLLDGARRVLAGESPYDPAMLGGAVARRRRAVLLVPAARRAGR